MIYIRCARPYSKHKNLRIKDRNISVGMRFGDNQLAVHRQIQAGKRKTGLHFSSANHGSSSNHGSAEVASWLVFRLNNEKARASKF